MNRSAWWAIVCLAVGLFFGHTQQFPESLILGSLFSFILFLFLVYV